jgi:ankyrin repeat protein
MQCALLWYWHVLGKASTTLEQAANFSAQRTSLQVDAKDAGGNTALHLACSCGNLAACRALVDASAQIDARNSMGHTPLWCALGTSAQASSRVYLSNSC